MWSELIERHEIPRTFDDTTLSWARWRRTEQLKKRSLADAYVQAPNSLSIQLRCKVIRTILLFYRREIGAPLEEVVRIVKIRGFAPSFLWNDAFKFFRDKSMNEFDLDPFGLQHVSDNPQ